jgi:hypothetical protein
MMHVEVKDFAIPISFVLLFSARMDARIPKVLVMLSGRTVMQAKYAAGFFDW